MAHKVFNSSASPVAQVDTLTVGGTPNGETYTILLGGDTVCEITDTSGTTTGVIDQLVAAWNAASNTHPYKSVIAVADGGSTMTLTALNAGQPFECTVSKTSGTGTFARAATTASAGPYHLDDTANWTGGTLPTTSDDVTITRTARALYGLDALSAVALGTLTIERGAVCGLNAQAFATSLDGFTTTSAKPEYRDAVLETSWVDAAIGLTTGSGAQAGSQRVNLKNNKQGASTTVIHSSHATPIDVGLPAVRLTAVNGNANVIVRSAPGGVGLAVNSPSETATFGTILVTDTSAATTLTVSEGVTYTNLVTWGGVTRARAAATVTKIEAWGGTVTTEGAFTVTNLYCKRTTTGSATIYANHTGTNCVVNAYLSGGACDTRQNPTARSWTNCTWSDEGRLLADLSALTITNKSFPSGPVDLRV